MVSNLFFYYSHVYIQYQNMYEYFLDEIEIADESATTSDAPEDDRDKDESGELDVDESEGTDGVSSEGEKASGSNEGMVVR